MIEVDGVEYATRAQIAQQLGVTRATVRGWEKTGRLHRVTTLDDGRAVYRWLDATRAERDTRHQGRRRTRCERVA